MTPAQIQRQLSVNRKILADMYYQLEAARSWRAFWSDPVRIGDIASEEDCKKGAYNFHKESVKLVPKIAAIVELQKTLKKSYQEALSLQRASRLVANGWLATSKVVPNVTERYEALRKLESDCKRDAMLHAGEYY